MFFQWKEFSMMMTLRKKCSYSELFWSVLSRMWTEYREILRISQYSVRMWENMDQNNSKKEDFSCSVNVSYTLAHYPKSSMQKDQKSIYVKQIAQKNKFIDILCTKRRRHFG